MTGPQKDPATPAKAQLPLPLPAFTPSYERESFIVSASNEAAWRAAQTWRSSREPLLVICGPEGSGKTHLASILAIDGGVFCSATAPPENHATLTLFDDMPAGEPKAFLGLIDDLMDGGTRVVLIGNRPPAGWAGGFEDLRTRIESAPRATILEPDEALIETVIAKGFRDRQLEVDRSVVVFAAPRLPRTFAAAHAFVARADALALKAKRGITVHLAQQLVDSIS
ncbi:MAG: hypothetical protein GXP06_03845 [Alphaproteobacteria bacterium]|nr:hypothetical protein [Alphaproteobacteria bacterium]